MPALLCVGDIDFRQFSGELVIPPNSESHSLVIAIVDDSIRERTENFQVVFSLVSAGTVTASLDTVATTASVNIIDDDSECLHL